MAHLSTLVPHMNPLFAGRPLLLGVMALILSGTAFLILVPSGAHLLHFDAKAHMVVSRRVFDNITPGWSQLGTVWLPLPHILNAGPAQNDFLYRTGLFASLLG